MSLHPSGFFTLERAFQAQKQYNLELLTWTTTNQATTSSEPKRSDIRKHKSIEYHFLQSLSKTQEDIFTTPFLHHLDELDSIDLHENEILYLFIISALLEAYLKLSLPIQSLYARILQFIRLVSSQAIQSAPTRTLKFAQLLFLLGETVSLGAIVRPLIILTEKSARPCCITCLHPIALKTCLLANHFKAALPLLTLPRTQVQQPITCQDILLYMYYGGLVFTGMKNFNMAIEFFGFNLSLPSPAVSKIQIESFKRFTLLSLMKDGSLPSWVLKGYSNSQGTSSMLLRRALKSHCAEYIHYATYFSTLIPSKVHFILQKHRSTFSNDQLLGLGKLTQRHFPILKLKQLTKTHLSLTFDDLGKHFQCTSEETERFVLQAILSGHIQARICVHQKLVQFLENPFSNTPTSLLNQKIHEALQTSKTIKDLDYHLQVANLNTNAVRAS